jgi:hypothetical protein
MAAIPQTTGKSNLLLTLPPELRNEIYAQVITTDFYELDPTISAKTFPRPRYGIFSIQRGIKAQGGTPSIAQTCQQIRAEALDVYYGRNTFALIGEDIRSGQDRSPPANRNAAHEWMQLIGDDAKYLRKLRFMTDGSCSISFLISVASNANGEAPMVTVSPTLLAKHSLSVLGFYPMEAAIRGLLEETGDMGKVWRAVVERALYPVSLHGKIYFDISEKGIEKARVNAPATKRRPSAKKNLPTKVNPAAINEMEISEKFVDLRQLVDRGDDSDFWKVGAPPAKQAAKSARALEEWKEENGWDQESDGVEIKAPTKNADVAKKLPSAMQLQDENSGIMEIEAPTKQAKKAKERRGDPKPGPSKSGPDATNVKVTLKEDPKAGPSISGSNAADVKVGPKRATRASTRKKVPRKL